jgi:hypothetical protein
MKNIPYTKQLECLSNQFHLYCVVSPTTQTYIDIYDIDKFGEPISSTGRRYRAETFRKAIYKAYRLEFENKIDTV